MTKSILRRFQIQVTANFQLLPDRNTSWPQWVFSPEVHLTRPDQVAINRSIPQDCHRSGGGLYVDDKTEGKPVRTNFWWASVAVRVLGLDVGAGVYYERPSRR